MIKFIVLTGLGFTLAGCINISPDPMPDDPSYAPVLQRTPSAPPPAVGALFKPGYELSLYNDRRAHRPGDILIVTLNENTSSSKSAETSLKKENETTLLEPTILGGNPTAGSLSLNSSLDSENEFTAEADSTQRNSLTGSIAVTIVDVLANGILVIRGEKWITLNQGEEYIRISGLVRPEDISDTNTVSSTQLADARIAYSGTGVLAQTNDVGWLAKFFLSPKWLF